MRVLFALLMVLGLMVGVLAMVFEATPTIPTLLPAFMGLGFVAAVAVILRGPIGRALAGQLGADQGDEELQARLQAQLEDLMDEIRLLRQENGEIQERLDFAERLLSRGPGPGVPDREGPA